ncbi:helix-turn-helix domain-containing protein [Eggerthella lenta]|jgi:excisionase family DNA binding protein|uniref:helix-turn-helix domain-containing protein n=1 Tax=Eggerthella lenta TaxID=84112 RepID=UPI00189828C5|nr:helix-turn-helix domain-containing protein [Eggerthella lenta]MCB5390650.1 helix-turn-helix domain-containing protein [Eggerthella lenta]
MDRLMTLNETCKQIGISYSKGQKLAKAGTLPFKKLGATWVIPRSVLYRELGLELPHDDEEKKYA